MSEEIRKNFASDNVTPACPEVMTALFSANTDSVASYGEDTLTQSLNTHFGNTFETEVAVFPIATGTAANSLALSAMVSPYAAVLCDQSAHINTDEGGAPEFYMQGGKLICLPSANGLLTPAALPPVLKNNAESGILAPVIEALALTQANEWGQTYDLQTLSTLCTIAHDHDLTVHMDGARLGNAIAHLGCTPAEATWKTGIDVLTFGGTKAGGLAAEAVVIFLNDRTRPLVKHFQRRIKRAGHLWSKHRFLSAQLLALLNNDLWLKNTAHANIMAARLMEGLRRHPAAQMPYERHSNEVFVVLPDPLLEDLETQGFSFYRWLTPEGVNGTLVRFVTSFYTRPEDVDALLAAIAA